MRCNRPGHQGDRELSPWEFDRHGRCRACHARGVRRAEYQRRGWPLDPPPGFVSIRVASARLGITTHALNQRIRLGWYPNATWKRVEPNGMHYINEEALHAR